MNKEKTLAAHRIKTKIAKATKNESKAKTKIAVVESKLNKVNEAFEVAKGIVDKHKETLKMCKDQILENKKLIQYYENLLDIKYQQIEEGKKEKQVLESKNYTLENQITELSQKSQNENAVNTKRYKNIINVRTKQLESLRNKCKKLQTIIEGLEKRVKANVVKPEEQAVKKHDAKKAKVESVKLAKIKKLSEQRKKAIQQKRLIESKMNRIAKIYSQKHGISEAFSKRVLTKLGLRKGCEKLEDLLKVKSTKAPQPKIEEISEDKKVKVSKFYAETYKIPETASMQILNKYPKNEALIKLDSLAKQVSKYTTEKKEAQKVNESKQPQNKVNESAISNGEGTSLYSMFL